MDNKYNLDIEYEHSLTEGCDEAIKEDALSDKDISSNPVNDNIKLYKEKDALLVCCGDESFGILLKKRRL